MNFSTPLSPESALLSRSAEAGLHLAMVACGVAPGDYVLAPSLSSTALAGALARAQAVPILFDVHPGNWLLDIDLMEEFLMGHTLVNEKDELLLRKDGRPIRAVLPVHLNGNPLDMNQLRFVAHRFYLNIIEDASEATGAFYRGHPVGTHGDIGVFCLDAHPSGYDDKGALLISRQEETLEQLPFHPLMMRHPEEYHFVRIGLEQLPALNKARAKSSELEAFLKKHFQAYPQIHWQSILPEAEPAFSHISFWSPQSLELQQHLARLDMQTATFTPPLHKLPAFQSCTYIRREDHASHLFSHCIRIPGTDRMQEPDWLNLIAPILSFFENAPGA